MDRFGKAIGAIILFSLFWINPGPSLAATSGCLACHNGIESLVEDMIHCGRCRSCQCDAKAAEEERLERHPTWGGEEHSHHSGERDHSDHPQLAQLKVVPPGPGLRRQQGGAGNGSRSALHRLQALW